MPNRRTLNRVTRQIRRENARTVSAPSTASNTETTRPLSDDEQKLLTQHAVDRYLRKAVRSEQ